MPRNYDHDDEEDYPIRPRHQRYKLSERDDVGDENLHRRSVERKFCHDQSDSEDENFSVQERRRPIDDTDRRSRKQTHSVASFVPRTLQSAENRVRNNNNSSAWSESRRDSWAGKENTWTEEPSKSKPWACATNTEERSKLRQKSYRQTYQEDDDDPDGTLVEEYAQPVRRPPPKSDYRPHNQRDFHDDEMNTYSRNIEIENRGSPQMTAESEEVNDHDSASLPCSNQSIPTTDDESTLSPELQTTKTLTHPFFSNTGGAKYGVPFTVPFLHLCPIKGENTALVQCLIVRNRDDISNKLYPTYSLYLEDKNKLLIVAKKMSFNSTSNYHLFDMSRGSVNRSSKLTKKSGNYLGKLRAADKYRSEYTIVTASSTDRKEIGAIVFDRNGIVNQLKEGCQPRKMYVKVPEISPENTPIEHSVTKSVGKKQISMIDLLKLSDPNTIFASKDPVFERGNYRLNFGGRVTMASVKNFQLASPDEPDNIICQFGKIAEDKFHLDYKTPLNAFQAFCLALCHFDT